MGEGSGVAMVRVTLSVPSAVPVTVQYAAVAGTAAAGSDYTAPLAGATLTFAPGTTELFIAVPIVDDLVAEAGQTFSVVLSAPTGAALSGAATAVVTIVDDDALEVYVDDATFTEGSGGGTVSETVTVRLNRLSDAAVTVTYAVTGKTATAGADFTSGATTVVIAAGALTGAVTVGVVADADAEGPETLEVVASGAVSAGAPATVVRATGVATILDDDSQQINVAGLTVVGEGSGAGTTTATVTVRLAQPATVPVTVDYATPLDEAWTLLHQHHIQALAVKKTR